MISRLTRTAPPARRAAKTFATVFAAVAFLSFGPSLRSALAQEADGRPVRGVLELFTSQGCSSCPPADQILSRYAASGDVLALSYHVDYWDYIGWKDALASRQNTDRQKAYGKTFGHRTVYTPQLVVNGSSEVAGAKAGDVAAAIDERDLRREDGGGEITLSQDGPTVRISALAPTVRPNTDGETVVVLVTYRRETQTQVSRGENEGRMLVNHHSVRDWRVVGKVTGKSMEIDMPVSMLADPDGAPTGCAVFLQEMTAKGVPGPIRAAAMLDLAE
jgi:hypothetical protein